MWQPVTACAHAELARSDPLHRKAVPEQARWLVLRFAVPRDNVSYALERIAQGAGDVSGFGS